MLFFKRLAQQWAFIRLGSLFILVGLVGLAGCATQQKDAFREYSQNTYNGWRLRVVPHPDLVSNKRLGFDLYNVYNTPRSCNFGGTDYSNSIDDISINSRPLRALKKCFEYQDAKGKYYYYYWAADDADDLFIQKFFKNGIAFDIKIENMDFTFSQESIKVVKDYLENIKRKN